MIVPFRYSFGRISQRLGWQLSVVLLFSSVCLYSASPPKSTEAVDTLQNFQARLKSHIAQPRFSEAIWGVKVISLDTGKTLFEHNADKLLKPASNAKLYSGALALDRLGPSYRFKTSLYATSRPDGEGTLKGNLIVYGRGDPCFAARFNDGNYERSLDPIVNALLNKGVKRIDGDLVGDESFFRGAPFGAGWTWDDLQYYYGAGVSALTVEDNVLDLTVRPGTKLGDPCEIAVSPATAFLNFVNQTKTESKAGKRSVELYRPLAQNTVFVSGTLPLGSSNHIDAVAVHRPSELFVTLLKDALAKKGIKVSGRLRTLDWIERGKEPADASKPELLADFETRPLREVLAKMMKPSQNLYAQLLLLHTGAIGAFTNPRDKASDSASGGAPPSAHDLQTGVTTEDLGLMELKKFLKEAGINDGEVLLEEGSGLSRAGLLTPNATVQLLKFMHRHKYADVFRDSLPIASVDGTLRNRMKETKAAGQLRAKTGRLRYVDTLSGYANSATGEQLAFSIMLNNYAGPANSGRDAVDALAVMLAEFGGKSARQLNLRRR